MTKESTITFVWSMLRILLLLLLSTYFCNARPQSTEISSPKTLPHKYFPVFGNNGTTFSDLFKETAINRRRVKREACKDRPAEEVLEYYALKLANRCWEDCDCQEGRYCTKHNWCHDFPKEPNEPKPNPNTNRRRRL